MNPMSPVVVEPPIPLPFQIRALWDRAAPILASRDKLETSDARKALAGVCMRCALVAWAARQGPGSLTAAEGARVVEALNAAVEVARHFTFATDGDELFRLLGVARLIPPHLRHRPITRNLGN